MIVTDQRVTAALAYLQEGASVYAKARAAHDYSEKREKTVLAQLCRQCTEERSMAAKEAWARCHPDYAAALGQTQACAEAAYEARAKREAAAAIVEAWRTEQSNERAHARNASISGGMHPQRSAA